jgi:hypothetical protein
MYIAGDDDGHGAVGGTGTHLHVTPDNVLAVRDTIRSAVDGIYDKLLQGQIDKFKVGACAQDPVSSDAELAWNHRLMTAGDSYLKRIHEYVDGLYDLIAKLTATAETYGLVEQANAQTMRGPGV